MRFHVGAVHLPAETTQAELAAPVTTLNTDPSIYGILVHLPLPKHLDREPIIHAILPEKDVDGLRVVNAGKVATGDLSSGDGAVPQSGIFSPETR